MDVFSVFNQALMVVDYFSMCMILTLSPIVCTGKSKEHALLLQIHHRSSSEQLSNPIRRQMPSPSKFHQIILHVKGASNQSRLANEVSNDGSRQRSVKRSPDAEAKAINRKVKYGKAQMEVVFSKC